MAMRSNRNNAMQIQQLAIDDSTAPVVNVASNNSQQWSRAKHNNVSHLSGREKNANADFSTVLRDTYNRDKNSGLQQDGNIPGVVENNRNLNDIVTRIRDEGPAVGRQDSGISKAQMQPPPGLLNAQQNRGAAAVNTMSGVTYTSGGYIHDARKPVAKTSPSVKQRSTGSARSSTTNHRSAGNGPGLHVIVLLLLVGLGVVGFSLYQLELRTVAMVDTLASMQQRVSVNGTEVADARMTVPVTDHKLDELRSQMTTFKNSQQDLRANLEVEISGLQNSQSKEMGGLTKKTHGLEQQLGRLQGELQTLQKTLGQLQRQSSNKVNAKPAIQSEAKRKEKSMEVVKSEGLWAGATAWAVNLISVSSEVVAKKQMTRLQKLGVSPEIERINMDGKTVYRLSVPGFSTRQKAWEYISKVKEKIDLDGAWVRPVN